MSKINGTLVLLKLGQTPSSLTHVENATFTLDVELPENTDKDSQGFRDILENAGVRSGSIDVSGFADWGKTNGNAKEVFSAVYGRENLGFTFGPEGVDYWQIVGQCRGSNVELGAPNEESAPISGTFETTGQFIIEDNN